MSTPSNYELVTNLREIVKLLLPLRDKYVELNEECYLSGSVTTSLDASPAGGRQTYSDPTSSTAISGFKAHQRHCVRVAAREVENALQSLLRASEWLADGWTEQVAEFKNVCYHCGNAEPKGLILGLCSRDYQYVRANGFLPSQDILNRRDVL